MEKVIPVKELNAVLVGSNSSRKYLVGNIILGREVFNDGDTKSTCARGEGEVCGRRVTLVKAPGWLGEYDLYHTSELFKTEAILSVTPGLHCFILVINAELQFKNAFRLTTKQHLQHFFGEKVWDHTIVVFSHRGHRNIEDYIREGGAPLQSVLETCGNRYHFLSDDGTDNKEKVKELFEKIDTMVAENSCYEPDSTLIQNTEAKRNEVDKRAAELHLQTQQQREKLRHLLTGMPTLSLRVLMVGWVFSGKSATANRILNAEVFQSGDRTMKALKHSGKVAGRDVTIVDTPGWWKFFPAAFTPLASKSEILNGVSMCSPSPNVILLAITIDTSFTDDQRRVIEDNMRLLGQRVWRHVIVVFTFGDTLGGKTVEQHIEGEGKPLCWLIKKCGNRYHVINNMSRDDENITELLEKMEEMVAGNSSFYLSAFPDADDPQPQEDGGYIWSEKQDEKTTNEIMERLIIEWDRKNWEKHHSCASMNLLPEMSEDKQPSDDSEEKEEQVDQQHAGDPHFQRYVFRVDSEDDAVSGCLNWCRTLLEREWTRQGVAMEVAFKTIIYNPTPDVASSEPDSDLLLKSDKKVSKWLTQHVSSGFGTASYLSCKSDEEDENEQTFKQQCFEAQPRQAVTDGRSQAEDGILRTNETN